MKAKNAEMADELAVKAKEMANKENEKVTEWTRCESNIKSGPNFKAKLLEEKVAELEKKLKENSSQPNGAASTSAGIIKRNYNTCSFQPQNFVPRG